MTFQQFVLARRIQNFVEHLESLPEQQANRLIESLDDQTIDLIETYMQEGMGGIRRKLGIGAAAALTALGGALGLGAAKASAAGGDAGSQQTKLTQAQQQGAEEAKFAQAGGKFGRYTNRGENLTPHGYPDTEEMRDQLRKGETIMPTNSGDFIKQSKIPTVAQKQGAEEAKLAQAGGKFGRYTNRGEDLTPHGFPSTAEMKEKTFQGKTGLPTRSGDFLQQSTRKPPYRQYVR
jgi:hypothetical protein